MSRRVKFMNHTSAEKYYLTNKFIKSSIHTWNSFLKRFSDFKLALLASPVYSKILFINQQTRREDGKKSVLKTFCSLQHFWCLERCIIYWYSLNPHSLTRSESSQSNFKNHWKFPKVKPVIDLSKVKENRPT